MIALDPQHLQLIKNILKQYVPHAEIRVFGSRITGKAKAFSDLDLAIINKSPLPTTTLTELKYAFSESDLPILIDIVDWHTLSDDFKKVIHARYEVLSLI